MELGINDVIVGKAEIVDSESVWRVARLEGDHEVLDEHRGPVKRTVGERMMHADMLGRLARWLMANDFVEAAPYVSGALEPEKHDLPPPEATKEIVAKLRSAMERRAADKRRGSAADRRQAWKDESYLEAAIFCVSRWRYD